MRSSLCFPLASVCGALALVALAVPPAFAQCGNGHIDGNESCDGADLGGKTCADVTSGFAQTGTLACNADCTLDTTDCRRAFIASLIPANTPKQNRCHLEFGTVGTLAAKGRATKRLCSEGDSTCDVDNQFNNACTFRIQLCMDVPDDRVPGCKPARIVRLDVLQPSINTDIGKAVASAVLSAARSAVPDQAHVSGNSVGFGPPVTDFSCGSATFSVPLRGTSGHARPGVVRLKARTSDNSGHVRSQAALSFTCMP